MEIVYRRFFSSISQFHKLRFGDLFPDMTKMDGMTLLTIAHFNCEHGEERITTSKLAGAMKTKASAISRTLKNLEEKGLIERTVNQADRRNTYVELTDQGRKVLEECKRMFDEVLEASLSKMSSEDMERLIGYLDELYRITEEEIESRKKKKERKREHE